MLLLAYWSKDLPYTLSPILMQLSVIFVSSIFVVLILSNFAYIWTFSDRLFVLCVSLVLVSKHGKRMNRRTRTFTPKRHRKKEKAKEKKIMTLTRDSQETVNARVQRDPEFAAALLDEAVSLFLNGEPETSRLILRALVNATVGFEELAIETSKPSKSLHQMLSAKGNPTMDNLTTTLNVLRKRLRVDIKVQTVSCI